jgi:Insecticide toxin TcdB middle/N-terminal region/Salmonella virulence plasmid 65kDa B protein/FG-GAP-like repeat
MRSYQQILIRSMLFVFLLVAGNRLHAQQMLTSGDASVSSSGAATFTFPIYLPPSTGGHSVNLGLVYNSQSGNSILGVGWSLRGLSSITRCPKSVAEDGVRAGVKDDASDLFCLNGQKLRLVSGVYGAVGAVYKTAIDDFSRITGMSSKVFGSRTSAPWFRVEYKNGQIAEFGNSVDSRLENPFGLATRIWMISLLKDRSVASNSIYFAYSKDVVAGSQVLTSVQFTNTLIELEYEERPIDDLIVAYDNGFQIGSTSKRVRTIRSYVNRPAGLTWTGPPSGYFKEYRLTYTQSGASRRSLLTGIQECGSGGISANCLPSTIFTYQNSNPLSMGWSSITRPIGMTASIDFRGNGKAELISPKIDENYPALGINDRERISTFNIWDYNSDGLVDFEFSSYEAINHAPVRNAVILSNGTSLGPSSVILSDLYYCHGDFDGDGVTDAIGIRPPNNPNQSPTLYVASFFSSGQINRPLNIFGISTFLLANALQTLNCKIGDINSDGRADLIFPSDDLGIAVTLDFSAIAVTGSVSAWIPRTFVGDFNGDGKTDNAAYEGVSGAIQVWYSNGFDLVGPQVAPSSRPDRNTGCTGDFNGDGRTDIFLNSGLIFLATSTGFYPSAVVAPPALPSPFLPVICADFDGDGKTDIYYPESGKVWSTTSTGPTDSLAQISMGTGTQVRFEYKSITDSSVYTKGSGATFPLVELQNATYVVSKQQVSDGRGGFVPTVYSYSALRRDVQRNGISGFRTVKSINQLTGVTLVSTYRQDYPYIGLTESSVRSIGARVLEVATFSYQAFDQTAQFARVQQTGVETKSYDLNGAFLNWIRESRGDFDAYGNSRLQQITHLDASGTTAVSQQTINQQFTNDASRWLIGQLVGTKTSSVVSSVPILAALGTPDPPAMLPPPPPPPPAPSIRNPFPAILNVLLGD